MDTEAPASTATAEPDAPPSSDSIPEARIEQGREAPTIWEAAQIAREEFDRESPDSDEADQDTGTEPERTTSTETPAATTTPPSEARKTYTEEAALDRVLTLLSQNRLHELGPEAKGRYQAIAKHAQEQAKQEAELQEFFNEKYVSMLALKEDDPEEYARLIHDPEEGDDLYQFMREYSRQHPDVSTANPRPSPRGLTEVELRTEIGNEYGTALFGALRALAEEKGVTNFDELQTKAKGGASLMVQTLDAAINAQVETRIAKIRAEERAAAEKEFQVKLNQRLPATPVHSAGRESVGGFQGVPTIREAAEIARREMR